MRADRTSVATVRLAWPQRRNALGPAEAGELTERLLAVGADDSTRAIVLAGDTGAFCAGGHLPSIVEVTRGGAEAVRAVLYKKFQGLIRTIRELPVPVIAAIEGPAIGLGCDIALACSIRVIGPGGWLRYGWAGLGLIPAPGGLHMLKALVGEQRAWEFIAADRLDGPKLESWGAAIASADAAADAQGLGAALAQLPAEAVRGAKQLLAENDFETHLAIALDLQSGFLTSERFRQRAAEALNRPAGRK